MDLDADVLVGLSRYSIMASKPAARFVAGIITSKVLSRAIPPRPLCLTCCLIRGIVTSDPAYTLNLPLYAVDFSEYAAFP